MEQIRDGSRRPYGSFGFQIVAGIVETDPAAPFTPGRTAMGLPIGPQYLYGSLHGVDSDRYYAVLRNFNDEVAIYLQVYEGDEGSDFAYDKSSHEAYRGLVDTGERDGKFGFWRDDGDGPRSLFLADERSYRWVEAGILDVSATAVGDSMQFAAPDARSPFVYTSRLFDAEGELKGERVKGFVWHETFHLPSGMGLVQSEVYQRLSSAWVGFATRFDDGAVNFGHLMWGPDNFDLVLVQRTDDEPVIGTGVEIELVHDDDEFPTRCVWKLSEEEAWEWETRGNRFPPYPMSAGKYRCVEGVVRRRGETRQWEQADGWIDNWIDRTVGVAVPGTAALSGG